MAADYVLVLGEPHDQHLTKRAQIAARVAQDIARGTLKPGTRLPGSRTLAAMVGVHRNTMNSALSDLARYWPPALPAERSW